MLSLVQIRSSVDRKFASCISALMQPIQPTFMSANLSGKIADALIGSKKVRLGSINPEQRMSLVNLIIPFIHHNYPIQMTTLWGSNKLYAADETRRGPDLADLFAIKRLVGIDESVRQVYPPGISFTVVRQDVGEYFINTHEPAAKIMAANEEYSLATDELVNVLDDRGAIKFVDESQIMASRGIRKAQLFSQALSNTAALRLYWDASNSLPNDERPKIPEYTALQKLGWSGILPNEAREHYLDRVDNEYGDINHSKKVDQVCKYLGLALAASQVKLYNFGDLKPIRTSFVPYPPGTPPAMGRLEYKVKDSSTSNKTVAPWAGYGFIEVGDTPTPRIVPFGRAGMYKEVIPQVVEVESPRMSTRIRADLAVL